MSRPATSNQAANESDDGLSMSSMLLAPLNELQSLAHVLFQSLSPPQSRPPRAPPAISFINCDKNLAQSINLAHKHQIKQRKIDALEAEILELDAQWRQICTELEEGKSELEAIIEEGDDRLKAVEEAKQASIPYPELLAYAQSLSAFTSAPPNMPDLSLPGQPPPPLFFPPFPNEEKMRRGRLNAEAPLGPLGETHSVGRVPSTVSPREPSVHVPGVNPYRQDLRAPIKPFFELDLDLNPDL